MTRDEAKAVNMVCDLIEEQLASELRDMLARGAGTQECLLHLAKRRDDLKTFRRTAMPRLWCAVKYGATLQ